MKHLYAIMLLAALAACGDGKKEAAQKLAELEREGHTAQEYLLDLQAYDLPLAVSLPQVLEADADSTYGKARWVEEFGHYRVSAGKRFDLIITEDKGDLARLKAGFERDLLRSFSVVSETPDLIVYRLQYPDEDIVFVHFYQVMRVGEREFVVESAPDGRFNEADIGFMAAAVRPSLPA
jgi:hypothetical protein